MALYKGNTKIKSLYLGGTKIQKLYKGSTLVYSSGYPSGTVLFENATAGTYTINVEYDCTVYVDLVGGGSGAFYANYSSNRKKGGSGAYISGTTSITAGTYSVVVGAGSAGVTSSGTVQSGGNSTFNSNTAGGAPSWSATPGSSSSSGGTATVSSSGLSGQNGSSANTTGWISGYGAGGNTTNNQAATINGKDGYCKIVVS